MDGDFDLHQLLALEADPALFELTSPETGILAWPAIRLAVMRAFLSDRIYPSASPARVRRSWALHHTLAATLRAEWHNVMHPVDASRVLLVGSGAGVLERGGKSFNRLTDHFATALGQDVWIAESVLGDRWSARPRGVERISFLGRDRLLDQVWSRTKLNSSHRNVAAALVDAAERGGRQVGWSLGAERASKLRGFAARHLAAYPVRAASANRLLDRVAPAVVLVEDGCYGHRAVLNHVARDRGILVAEFQHGMVTRGHDAYNVGAKLAAAPLYRSTMPNVFLSFGRWWNDQFNAPVDEKVVVGAPHREESLKSWKASEDRSVVLLVGDGFETPAYLDLARRLGELLPPSLRVEFRPHPIERGRVAASSDVVIDEKPDVYASLANSLAVIGEASTVLFEAAGLVPYLFVWDTPKSRFYLGDHPFARFTEPAELVDSLQPGSRPPSSASLGEGFWAPGWRENFLKWIENLPSPGDTGA